MKSKKLVIQPGTAKYEGTTRFCPVCFRSCQIIKGGRYPNHRSQIGLGEELCPVSGRPVQNNGVIM